MQNKRVGGKLPARKDTRTLLFSNYLETSLPTVPDKVDYSLGIDPSTWGMMLNDSLGDCAIAAPGHLEELWSYQSTGTLHGLNNKDILKAYCAVSGYNPRTKANDNGCNELDVLKYWSNKGIAGHKISAYAAINPKNVTNVKLGLYLFNGLYLGFELPKAIADSPTWEITGTGEDWVAGSLGGHAVNAVAFDPDYITVISWGSPYKVSWDFFKAYADESWLVISDMYMKNGKSPQGFDMPTLLKDQASLRG